MQLYLFHMDKSKDIDTLIATVLSGSGDECKKLRLEKWIKASPENESQFRLLEKIWKERSSEVKLTNSNELAKKIWEKGLNDR